MFEHLLAADDPDVLSSFGISCTLPTEVRVRLAAHPVPAVRATAIRRNAPSELLERLVDDPSPDIRDDVQRALLTDVEPEGRARAISVWHRPPPRDLIEQLLADPATRVNTVRHVPISGELIASPDPQVRRAVAHHLRAGFGTHHYPSVCPI